ncbi:Doc Prophage maintenance system killer protein [Candidatus Nanopelagicaceae bacterium]
MPAIQYLTVPDVLAMHMVLIKKYGGSDGIRDMGALESALARPQSGYYKDVIESAAALLESLPINHPFIDGNKRVAFAATDTFLRINGYEINSNSESIHKSFMKFFDLGEFNKANLELWLRNLAELK